MRCLSATILWSALTVLRAYPWGTDRCGPPNHPGGSSTASSGIDVSISGTTVTLSSSSRFRGFYMSTNPGVSWTTVSSGTSASNLCGGGNTVLTHSSSVSRSSVSANLSCSDGQTVTITAYVVYSYESPYISISKPVVCSKALSSSSSTPPSSPAIRPPNSSSDATTLPVEPHYLIHGFVFISLFAVLMPVTAFLILINKSLFYTTHKVLGVIAIILLAIGWAILNWADDDNPNYAPLAYVKYGKDHEDYGSIGCYVAAGVCGTGVLLWFLRLPKTMKSIVRYIHGIAGGLLALYGPFVVWTGWIRLAPASISALDSTPLVWMSLAITLACAYVILLLVRRSQRPTPRDSVALERIITRHEIDQMVASGKLVVVVDGVVCEISPSKFNHPGGMDVLWQYNGKEVGGIMRGSTSAMVKNRSRVVAHSDYAIRLAMKMRIGNVAKGADLEQGIAGVASAPVIVPPPPHKEQITGTLVTSSQINKSIEFPVRLLRIRVNDLRKFGKDGIGSGSRVNMSFIGDKTGLTRPYTVVSVNVEDRTVDFAIKIYTDGIFTSKLAAIKTGGKVGLSEAMMHAPVPSIPSPPTMLIMIAGGTGITPMLSYIRECGKYALGGVILWWVRNSSDLFLTEELDEMCPKYPLRINVYFTQPGTDPEFVPGQQVVVGGALRKDSVSRNPGFVKKAIEGRISAAKILEGVGGFLPVDPRDIGVVMSGPDGFIESATRALNELEIPPERLLCLD